MFYKSESGRKRYIGEREREREREMVVRGPASQAVLEAAQLR